MKVKRLKVITSESPQEFENEVNKILEQDESATIQYNMNLGHCAYVFYKEDTTTYEEKPSDLFHQSGIVYLCKHCPRCEISPDRRKKRAGCSISTYGMTWIDDEACEFFLQVGSNWIHEAKKGGRMNKKEWRELCRKERRRQGISTQDLALRTAYSVDHIRCCCYRDERFPRCEKLISRELGIPMIDE